MLFIKWRSSRCIFWMALVVYFAEMIGGEMVEKLEGGVKINAWKGEIESRC